MECEGGVEVWRGFVGFYWAGCRGVEGCVEGCGGIFFKVFFKNV